MLAGLSGSQISLALTVIAGTILVGTLGWTRLFARLRSNSTVMLIALAGWMLGQLGIVALNNWGLRPVVLGFAGSAVVLGMATLSGFTPAALAHLADVTGHFAMDRGSIMGLYSVFLGLGQVSGGVSGGPIAQTWGLNGMSAVSIALLAIAWVSVSAIARRDRLSRKEAACSFSLSQSRP
jgi:predicted MFS family arabinose efflux permease